MKKKIFYLLLLCLMVLGRGEVWAETYILKNTTATASATVYKNDSESSTVSTWKFVNNSSETIEIAGSSSGTCSNGNNETVKYNNGTTYTVTGIPSTEKIVSVEISGYANYDNDNCYVDFSGIDCALNTPASNNFTRSNKDTSFKYATFSVTGEVNSFSFTPRGTQCCFIITITTEEKTIDDIYSGTYPYTWDFTVERDKWAKSITQFTSDATNWLIISSNSVTTEARNNGNISNSTVDIIKGLSFTASANSVAPGWAYNLVWLGKGSNENNFVTVPSLTAGQIVTFTTNENIPMTAISNAVQIATNQFLITSNGGVSFYTTNDLGVHIRKIAVTNQDLTVYNSTTKVYEWKFNDPSWWVTTSSILSNNWYLDTTDNNIYKYKTSISSVSPLYVNGLAELPETNNLTFQNANNERVGFKVGEYLWINTNTVVTLPSLPVGLKITIKARNHGGGNSATMNVSNATLTSEKNISSSDQDFVYTVNSTSPVTITANGGVIYIGSIKIEKNDYNFSLHYVQNVTDGSTLHTTSFSATPKEIRIMAYAANTVAATLGTLFTVESSHSEVIDVSKVTLTQPYIDKKYFWNLKTGSVGSSVVTFKFNGNDIYNPASFSVTLTVTKANPTLAFTTADKGTDSQSYSEGMSYSNALTYPADITTSKISYSSSNTSVATVNSSTGAITVVAPGTTTIRATFAGDDNYNSASTYFTLTLNGSTGPTIAWESGKAPSDVTFDGYDASSSTVTMTYGQHDNTLQCVASVTNGSGTVNYISDDTSVATVSSDGTVTLKGVGTATITAFVPGTSSGTNPSNYLSYNIISSGGSFTLEFQPSSGYVNVGATIAPHLNLPTIELDDISELKLKVYSDAGCTIESESIARVVATDGNLLSSDYLKMQGTKVNGVYPIIEGVSTGTAYVKVSFKSNGVYADATAVYQVNVTSASTCNFSWDNLKDGNNNEVTDYYLTTGEYMFIPTISGNSNGNFFGYSKGSVCLAEQAYVYTIKNGNVEWNNEDYYHGEGIPNYDLTSNGGTAYIFYCKGQNLRTHRLMIYGLSAGDVILTATDPQTGIGCGEITIHIVDKATNVTAVNTTYWGAHTFPYTWDFTNVSASDITDDGIHWIAGSSNEHKLGMATSLSYDYADEDNNGISFTGNSGSSTRQDLEKYFTNVTKTSGEWSGCELMPQFYGLTLTTGNSSSGSYESKVDRLSLYDSEASDPGLNIVGGTHNIFLPSMPTGSYTSGKAFKVIMKVKGTKLAYKKDKDGNLTSEIDKGNSSHVNCHVRESSGSYTEIENEKVVYNNGEEKIIDFDISAEHSGKVIRLGFDQNVKVYWIACSTEERTATKKADITSYAAATYCYNEDLDLAKSVEANSGTKVYRASNFNSETSTVTLTAITDRVPALTGLVLKSDETSSNYMIATGRNTDSYSTPQDLVPVAEGDKLINLLKPAPVGTVVTRFVNSSGVGTADMSSEDIAFTNFVLTSSYKKVDENGNDISGFQNSDWMYYRVNATTTSTNNMSYLQLPNKLREIGVDVVDGARKAVDGTQDYKLSNLINIVFEDELQSEVSGINVKQITPSLNVNDAWYTLQGVRVDKPAKGGVYIQRGRKVILK